VFGSLKSNQRRLPVIVDDDGTVEVASVMVIDKDAVTDNAATNRLDAATDHLDLSVSAR
jgi:hypothetical protein